AESFDHLEADADAQPFEPLESVADAESVDNPFETIAESVRLAVLGTHPEPAAALPSPAVVATAAPGAAAAHRIAAGPKVAAASPPSVAIASKPERRTPLVDSTRTERALTALELSDDQASRWFVIQLALSEEPIDPAEVPNLGIFVEYRLYSVSGLD